MTNYLKMAEDALRRYYETNEKNEERQGDQSIEADHLVDGYKLATIDEQIQNLVDRMEVATTEDEFYRLAREIEALEAEKG